MTNFTKETFGEFIKHFRKKEGLTLTTVAEKLSIDYANLSKIENGIRDFDKSKLDKLAIILNVDLQNLRDEYIADQIGKKIFETNCNSALLAVAEKKAEYRKIKDQNKRYKT